ncbi:arylamine N-acetyltransferase [Novosphingobium sp. FSY-8]|uniref:Arylamine N-acetyltransferase n=1 Tax=Novosphingobium ovatum TaxID=1908523 RepID=A0ABW9XAK3_9SPHN|nr:arylamine N-acetyltransferase [Novosphingobium ovatum]NBC35562.1 arylamine N-acetyltransferase [Novosphingobium ovatum]
MSDAQQTSDRPQDQAAPTGAALLAAYLRRIGVNAPVPVSPEGLGALQMAHRTSIAFENLDIALGRPIVIDLPSITAKLVTGGRGGYCFEHNRLFGEMLAALGFANRPLLGRVWIGAAPDAGDAPPRTHTLRLVDVGGEPWIADAGFGASYVPPLPLQHGAQAMTADGACHRLLRIGVTGARDGEWVLERFGPLSATDGRAAVPDTWVPQYSFDLSEVAPVDLEMSNHWTSTRPNTRFTSAIIASIVLPDGFVSLNGRRLTMHHGGRGDVMEIASAQDWQQMAADLFGIEMSDEQVAALGLF